MSFVEQVKVTGNVGGVVDTTLGSAKPANVIQVGGNDGTNAYGLPLASGGGSLVTSGSSATTQVTSLVSSGNSSTTPLTAGSTFTGTSVDLITLGYVSVQIEVLTDKAGTLQMQFSPDNSNWDHTTTVAVPASNSTSVASGIHGRYVRTVMTNTAGTNQTFMRLQTILIPGNSNATIKDLESPVTIDDNALITHSLITGITTAGGSSFVDVKVNPSGTLATQDGADGTTGSAVPSLAMQVGGTDGTNLRAIPLSNVGASVLTTPGAPTVSKYSQAAITFSGSGDNTLVAASGSTTIRVYRIFFVNSDSATATNITIKDSTPTNLSGAFRLASGGSFGADGDGDPLYVGAAGKGFQLNSSAAVQISGTVWYTQS